MGLNHLLIYIYIYIYIYIKMNYVRHIHIYQVKHKFSTSDRGELISVVALTSLFSVLTLPSVYSRLSTRQMTLERFLLVQLFMACGRIRYAIALPVTCATNARIRRHFSQMALLKLDSLAAYARTKLGRRPSLKTTTTTEGLIEVTRI